MLQLRLPFLVRPEESARLELAEDASELLLGETTHRCQWSRWKGPLGHAEAPHDRPGVLREPLQPVVEQVGEEDRQPSLLVEVGCELLGEQG